MENMSMKSTDDATGSGCSGATETGTFNTAASKFTKCSNVCFSKLLTNYNPYNELQVEMLKVLKAVTKLIKEKGFSGTTTAYFIEMIKGLKDGMDNHLTALLSLLFMCIKSVSQPVLRKAFSDAATVFTDILVKNEQSENLALQKTTIRCMSVLLKAQQYSLWGDSSTMRAFESVLAFALNSKPKVRKTAQHAVASILWGSFFMLPSDDPKREVHKVHPASNRVAEYCLSQINAEVLPANHKPVLHTLNMLRDVLAAFNKKYIKSICEVILSLMTHNNVLMKICCLRTLHDLFSNGRESSNMTASLAVQLTGALIAAQPPANDMGQVQAWAAVLTQGFGCLAKLDLNLCIPNLPLFVNICVTELWLSDVADINSASTNALKAVLIDCVKLALDSDETFIKHKSHIDAIFKIIGTGLDNPFNQAIKQVILTIAVCFEIGNENVADSLGPLLGKLIDRCESHNFENETEVEYATGCAIKSLGPEFVLSIIPLRDGPDTINLERIWLLPVLKEKNTNSNLKFFATEIFEMATFCRNKSRELTEMKDTRGSYDYELLCNQFWALLPSFCNNAKDIKDNFKSVTKVLLNVLMENPEFRLTVMQALRKLITCSADKKEDLMELGRFAKDYLPILLNIYMSSVKGRSAEGQRLAALETIQVYLTISGQPLREELFTNALEQLEISKDKHFQRKATLDVLRALVIYQSSETIAKLFEEWVYPLCRTVLEDLKCEKARRENETNEGDVENEDKKKEKLKYKKKAKLIAMEHKKAYRILEEIFKSDNESCKCFLKENYKKIKKLLMSSLNMVADSSKGARLRCIEHLINTTPFLKAESKLLQSAIAESVICTKDINSKCRKCAFTLINSVGKVLKTQEGGMQAFVNMLTSSLAAPVPRIVSATLLAITSALSEFAEDMGQEVVKGLFNTMINHMADTNREVIAACMSFLKVYTTVLPADVLSGSLPLIFGSLSSIPEDCKRHSRREIGHFLTKMFRKFGSDVMKQHIPETDTIMLRRLRNIRKAENRKRRQKKNQRYQSDNYSDGEMQSKGTSRTLEHILRDSDSDMEFMDEEENEPKPKVRKTMKRRTAPDGRLIITDDDGPKPSGDIDTDTDDTDSEDEAGSSSKLLKPGSKRRYDEILSVKNRKSGRSRASTSTAEQGIHRYQSDNYSDGEMQSKGTSRTLEQILRDSDSDMEFMDEEENEPKPKVRKTMKRRTAPDGRLIITDDDGPKPSGDIDTDTDDTDSEDEAGSSSKLLKPGSKRRYDEILSVKNRKSGRSRASTSTAEQGIHRPLGSAASVASGVSTEYRSKKAKGDVKKEGILDPYAYFPMLKENLNKRKKRILSKLKVKKL